MAAAAEDQLRSELLYDNLTKNPGPSQVYHYDDENPSWAQPRSTSVNSELSIT